MKGGPSRKDRILDAALVEFAQRGAAGARTAAIADAAGVNKQLIFYYFGSKAGLYEAVLRTQLISSITEPPIPAASASPIERTRAFLHRFWGGLARRPEVGPLLIRALAESGPARATLTGALGELEGRLASIVTEGQGHGYVRDDVDPRSAAAQIVCLLLGYLVREGTEMGRGPSSEGRARWVDETCDLMTRALRW